MSDNVNSSVNHIYVETTHKKGNSSACSSSANRGEAKEDTIRLYKSRRNRVLKGFVEGEATGGDIWRTIPFLVIKGMVSLGLAKLFWVEGIHRISTTKANCITTLQPILTILAAFFLLAEKPHWRQFVGLIPLIVGAWVILTQKFLLPEEA